jgi:hypothetical protein
VAINPDVIARAVVLTRQANSRCVVVLNRDLDIGKGADECGHAAAVGLFVEVLFVSERTL